MTERDESFDTPFELAQEWFDELDVGDEYHGVAPVAEELFDNQAERDLFIHFAYQLVSNAGIFVDEDNIIVSMVKS